MKKYDSYKDSGIKFIGEIPTEWDRVRIKALVSAKVSDGPHETPQWKKSGIPFISAEAIKGNKIDFDYKRGYISQEQHTEYSKKSKAVKGDILFCKSGSTTGKSAFVNTDLDFGIWSPLAIIRADENKIFNRFLFHFIQSGVFRRQVETEWTFGTQPNIGMGSLENLWITIPNSVELQTQIANYLDHKTAQIDQLIEKKEKLISLLLEERTAVINQAVTKGLDSNVRMKDSGIEWLGEIPEHWEVSRIKYYFDAIGGYAFSSSDFCEEGVQLVKIGNLYQNKLSLERQPTFVSFELAAKYPQYQANKNDVLLSLTGTLGKRDYGFAILINEELNLLVNQRVAKISAKNGMDIRFGIKMFHSETYLNKLMSIPTGTKQGNLSCDDVLSIHMAIPPLEEQKRIANHLESEFQSLSKLEMNYNKEIELLKEYKTALISEVVTGKIDVRDEKY